MAIYAVGDLQGCHDALLRLLEQVGFEPDRDRLWLAGDLVNRGPQSLQTLRFVRGLGDAAVSVLGNHDLHLLAVAAGGKASRLDTLDEILAAPDRDELLAWLSRRPLLHESGDGRWAMLHAGLPPQWSMEQARNCAREAEAVLAGNHSKAFFEQMYGNQPDRWDDGLRGMDRLRLVINCYTRLRFCEPGGRLLLKEKGAPGSQPAGALPWFAVPGRASTGTRIVFGHWSTLGRIDWPEYGVYGLDTGCVWGGRLSALRLDDGKLFSVDCQQYRQPGGD